MEWVRKVQILPHKRYGFTNCVYLEESDPFWVVNGEKNTFIQVNEQGIYRVEKISGGSNSNLIMNYVHREDCRVKPDQLTKFKVVEMKNIKSLAHVVIQHEKTAIDIDEICSKVYRFFTGHVLKVGCRLAMQFEECSLFTVTICGLYSETTLGEKFGLMTENTNVSVFIPRIMTKSTEQDMLSFIDLKSTSSRASDPDPETRRLIRQMVEEENARDDLKRQATGMGLQQHASSARQTLLSDHFTKRYTEEELIQQAMAESLKMVKEEKKSEIKTEVKTNDLKENKESKYCNMSLDSLTPVKRKMFNVCFYGAQTYHTLPDPAPTPGYTIIGELAQSLIATDSRNAESEVVVVGSKGREFTFGVDLPLHWSLERCDSKVDNPSAWSNIKVLTDRKSPEWMKIKWATAIFDHNPALQWPFWNENQTSLPCTIDDYLAISNQKTKALVSLDSYMKLLDAGKNIVQDSIDDPNLVVVESATKTVFDAIQIQKFSKLVEEFKTYSAKHQGRTRFMILDVVKMTLNSEYCEILQKIK